MTDREKKKDGMENPSLLAIHIQPYIQETSPVWLSKGHFTRSYSSSCKLKTTVHECTYACVHVYTGTEYGILSRLVFKNHQPLDFFMWPQQTYVQIQLKYK